MSLQPGIHEIDPEEYHRDPTETVSLSSSGIRTLLKETPAHFAARHPKLTQWPDLIRESTDAQKLGQIVHRLILGRGSEYVVMDPSQFANADGSPSTTWGSKNAKKAKEEAEAQGLVVIDTARSMRAEAVANNAKDELKKRFGTWPIGESEQTMVWRRMTDHGEITCRALTDHWSERYVTVLDVKSTDLCIGDDDLQKKIAAEGADIQAAFYLEGIEALYPDFAGLAQFVFVFVEVTPPFGVRFVKLTESWRTRAKFRIDRAANIFAECLKRNEWPAWGSAEVSLSAPTWLESKWEAQELEEVANG